VGDEVLAVVARCLAKGLRGADVVGRWGGEEFLAIVDTTSEATLTDVAERLRTLIARESAAGIRVTASFGSAVCHRFTTLGDLIVSADRALYNAKAGGRNRCVLATDPDAHSASSGDVARRGISRAELGGR
jgi:diguanylate cyclase (GGDEF)-like protein